MVELIWKSYLVHRWQYYITRPHKFIYDCYRELRAFYQRGMRGWADCDTWSFDDYLSRVIPGGLKRLKDYIHGCPCEFTDDQEGKPIRDVEEGCKEWAKVLQKMIDSFELNTKEQDEWPYQLTEEERKTRDEGYQLFIKYFGNLWD